ncbi:MAG: 8-oxo-dGTP pyrophosphatase MutT (NUDIX family) [Nitriliruptoraceae bacterium]|jgi:8-oxo-dGTP pyrophosphatase MutT (NUDIX family)
MPGMDSSRRDPTTSPWRTVASRPVYENPWIAVREDDVVTPTGTSGIYGVVHKPLALGVVAIDAQDRVVLVGQWRYPLDRYSWELVEGAFDHGEDDTPLAGIQRELAEEAGLAAARWELLTATPIALSNSVTDEMAMLWVASGLTPVVAKTSDPTEELRVTRVPFAEAVAATIDGRIDDAMSILGLLLADRRR